jgi:hypothetical protein
MKDTSGRDTGQSPVLPEDPLATVGGENQKVDLSRGSRLTARNTGDEAAAVLVVSQRRGRFLTMPCFPPGFELSEKS